MHLRTAAELPAKRTASPHKIILYTTDQTYSSGFIGSILCSISRIFRISPSLKGNDDFQYISFPPARAITLPMQPSSNDSNKVPLAIFCSGTTTCVVANPRRTRTLFKRCLSELCIYKTAYTTYAPYHHFCYFHTLTPFFFLLVKIFLSHHSHLSIMYIVMLVNTKTPLIHILSKNVHLL